MNHLTPTFRAGGVIVAVLAAIDPALASGTVYVTNQGGSVTLLDADRLTVQSTIDLTGSDPRGLAVTPDGKYLLTANQKSGDVSIIDTVAHKVQTRVPVGRNPEFLRVLPDGKKAFVTYEPSSEGKPSKDESGKDADGGEKVPAQVAIIDLNSRKVVASIVGAPETEGIEFSKDGKRLAIANEGNDTVTVYDIATTQLQKTVDLHSQGSRPRGIKLAPDGSYYVVTLENSNGMVILDADFNPRKTVPTGKGPYGVAFDKTGKHIVVAAARDSLLQVFDAKTYAKVAEVPVGKRCWHFTYSPDDSRLFVACGRSNDVEVIDTATWQRVQTISGFSTPWGIVTFPKANGSLDASTR
ncbi:MAG TPA: beta-propeller fold lactonase family protein [Candidatus Margulisiibacteriota bacterium]|nr:beta-propeller fold lactonase family protein [Candidatus Margulisiibacteriota bacterium]